MNYFDTLPIELNTIIVSYFSYDDYYNFKDLEININFLYLFKVVYGKYYCNNIFKYNIKQLYEEFLNRMNNKTNNNDYMYKYLMMNNFVTKNIYYALRIDDVELFQYCENETMDKSIHIYSLFRNKQYNILDYVLLSEKVCIKYCTLKGLYDNCDIPLRYDESIFNLYKYTVNDLINIFYFKSICLERFYYILYIIDTEFNISSENIYEGLINLVTYNSEVNTQKFIIF